MDLFQPTLPVRGATDNVVPAAISDTFQPTLPVRGATFWRLNLHFARKYFNPRSPCGERPAWLGVSGDELGISTHAPRAGSDTSFQLLYSSQFISTHAPRAGSDQDDRSFPRRSPHFNPRSPCGERPVVGSTTTPRIVNFNPRSPCGERPFQFFHDIILSRFQPTLPVRGATVRLVFRSVQLCLFQPTLPVRGATQHAGSRTPWR